MADSKLPFEVMEFPRFLEAVVAAVDSPILPGRPAFALLLGAGFSFPLVPTASGMVLRDIPWWLFPGRDRSQAFVDYPFGGDGLKIQDFAKGLWKKVKEQTGAAIKIDEDSGLPDGSGDNIGIAYRAVMSSRATCGLNTLALQTTYLRDVAKRIDKRINFAHLFLAAILQAQYAWKHRRPFCHTVLTPNFDVMLQRALQLHGQLYYMSDQPDLHVEAPADDYDALHLFYTHGSIYRPFVANSDPAITAIQARSAISYQSYFERHGVIVMGYGGWDDCTMKALESCPRFSENLYWCDIHTPSEAAAGKLRHQVSALLAGHRGDAFYVQLPEDGADAAMQHLHEALGLKRYPQFLLDPLAGLIDELENLDVPQALPGPSGSRLASSEGKTDQAVDETTLEDPVELKKQMIAQLKRCQSQYLHPQELQASQTQAIVETLMTRALSLSMSGDLAEAQSIWTTVCAMSNAPAEQKAKALNNRGIAKGKAGDTAGEMADFTAVINMADAPAEQKAKALVNRGITREQTGDSAGAIADFTAAIDIPDAPAEQKTRALNNRGVIKGKAGDTAAAMADFTPVLHMPDAPAQQKARALINRGVAKGRAGDAAGEMADFTAAIDMADAPAEQKAKALVNRGITREQAGDTAGAITDFAATIDMNDAPAQQKAMALVHRAVAKGRAGDAAGEMADFTAVIDMRDAPLDQKAMALVNRGVAKGRAGDAAGEMADYTAAIDMPGAPPKQKVKAMFYRAAAKEKAGDVTGAVADFTDAIEIPNAPAKQKAKSLIRRGIARGQAGDTAGATADFTAAIDMPDAPAEQQAHALVLRGINKGLAKDIRGASADFTAAINIREVSSDMRQLAELGLKRIHNEETRASAAPASGKARKNNIGQSKSRRATSSRRARDKKGRRK